MTFTFATHEIGERMEWERFAVGPVTGSIVREVTDYRTRPCEPAVVTFEFEVIVDGKVIHRSERLERAYAVVDAIVGALVVREALP